jgi:hypothetical protein
MDEILRKLPHYTGAWAVMVFFMIGVTCIDIKKGHPLKGALSLTLATLAGYFLWDSVNK